AIQVIGEPAADALSLVETDSGELRAREGAPGQNGEVRLGREAGDEDVARDRPGVQIGHVGEPVGAHDVSGGVDVRLGGPQGGVDCYASFGISDPGLFEVEAFHV